MADWLSRLADDALAAVLDRRPDAVLGRPPSTLGLLAERLSHPASLVAALRGLSTPGLQIVEALQALGERRTRAALIDLLDGPPGVEHEAAVDAVLAELTTAALVWPGEGDRLDVPSGLGQVLPAPLGLGPPARAVWAQQTVDAIARALRALGGRPEGNKANKLEALLARFADPERIRAQAAQAPPAIAADLRRLAWAGVDGENDDDLYNRFDPEAYRQRRETEQWAVAHGLLAGETWGYGYAAPMPAEVALALRGPDFRTPFTPRPPSVVTHDVAPEVVESAAAAAITAFTAHAVALLDRVARTPVAQLAGGGVGVRELGRLAKELGVEEIEVRLVLALAAATELLWPNDDGALGVSEQFDQWRQAEPAIQAASLLAAWWVFPTAPTQARDDNGKALPVLQGTEPCGGCQAARVVLVEVAAGQPAGTAADPGELARLARWHRPMVHVLPQDADAPLATVWREAELLGVVAAGAVSPVGAALLAEDLDVVLAHLRRMLPGVTDTATFGSDLTALVAGSPLGWGAGGARQLR